MNCNIVWFRRDLRLSDNEIVALTSQSELPTVFIFTLDERFFRQPDIGVHRARFLIESLLDLDKNLRRLGGSLILLEGNSTKTLEALLSKLQASDYAPILYKNRDRMGHGGIRREQAVEDFCKTHNIPIHTGQSSFLSETELTKEEWNKQYYRYQEAPQWKVPQKIIIDRALDEIVNSLPHVLVNEFYTWVEKVMQQPLRRAGLFVGGEVEAQRLLTTFLRSRYKGYHWKLSRPYLAEHGATSQLSPHISFGTISTRQINASAYTMKQRLKTDAPNEVKTFASFLSRLRWRDSFTQRYALHPELKWQNAYPEFDKHYTAASPKDIYSERFEHWKDGTTGFPLLDASMRALNEHGWMTFRMRAQAVTMLTIIFGVSWHHGAEYFMQKLVDGDVAINHWQWQMQAGIVNPLSETFRIYNPTTNLRDRDPRLQYVHEWLPEYADCKTVEEVLKKAQPIVDWKYERKERGTKVSNLRRKTRERLQREASVKFEQAEDLHRASERIKEEYKRSRK